MNLKNLMAINSFPFRFFQKDLLVGDDKYPHIVHVNRETTDNIQREVSSSVSTQTNDLEGLSNYVLCILRNLYVLDIYVVYCDVHGCTLMYWSRYPAYLVIPIIETHEF